VPWRPFPRDIDRVEPRPLSASLDRLAASLGAPAPGVLTAVFARWEGIVGPHVAGHARPLTLRDGVLVIGVDQPAWATELTHLKADLLRRIGEATGSPEVTEVRVRVSGPTPRRSGRGRPER
jgi:predicted nucleic acid-binding Zn ribbon protein